MKKNGILTLLFACIPGAGQMYQGYMKRGLSLITMFCLCIIVGSATGLDALVVGCIVVYMYSFFDTLNLRAQLAAEKAPEDDYLVHFDWHDARMTQFMGESHKLVGWGLIALGAQHGIDHTGQERPADQSADHTADDGQQRGPGHHAKDGQRRAGQKAQHAEDAGFIQRPQVAAQQFKKARNADLTALAGSFVCFV